jgi:hypothetical protein
MRSQIGATMRASFYKGLKATEEVYGTPRLSSKIRDLSTF